MSSLFVKKASSVYLGTSSTSGIVCNKAACDGEGQKACRHLNFMSTKM